MKPKLKSAFKNVLKQSKLIQKKHNAETELKNAISNKKKGKNVARSKRLPPSRYSADDTILLIGEGNFSFARSLVESVLHTGHNVIATTYDSRECSIEKYGSEVEDHVKAIEECGGTVFFGIDGTKLEKYKMLKKKTFSRFGS
jgi:25S rRNA (uracil2634-N3)-methyltransferase